MCQLLLKRQISKRGKQREGVSCWLLVRWQRQSQAPSSSSQTQTLSWGSCRNTSNSKVACVLAVYLFEIITKNQAWFVSLKQNLQTKIFQLFQLFSFTSINLECTQWFLLLLLEPSYTFSLYTFPIARENTNTSQLLELRNSSTCASQFQTRALGLCFYGM